MGEASVPAWLQPGRHCALQEPSPWQTREATLFLSDWRRQALTPQAQTTKLCHALATNGSKDLAFELQGDKRLVEFIFHISAHISVLLAVREERGFSRQTFV